MQRQTTAARRATLRLALLASLPLINAEQAQTDVIRFGGDVLIEAREAGDTSKQSTVAIVAYNGGGLVVAGYDAPVYLDLSGGNGFDKPLPLLRDHDKQRITGTVQAKIVGNTIEATGRLVGSGADRQQVEELARDGYAWQASVGARPLHVVKVNKGQSATVNGQAVAGPAYIAKKWRLAEISLVTIGADADTSVSLEMVAASDPDDTNGGEGLELNAGDSLNKIKLERFRRKSIEAAAVKLINEGGDIDAIEEAMQEAIAGSISATDFELQLLRKHRRTSGLVSSGGRDLRGQALNQAVEAAIRLTLGASASELEADYPEPVLAAMDRNPLLKHGLSLKDAMIFICEQNGQRVSRGDVRAMLTAFAPVEASGLSTHSLSGIFSNIANKRMKASFDSVESVWREIAEISPVSDFKTITSYSLTGDMTYERVAPGGELKHATKGERSYTNAADTYGKMFSLDRRDIINDDLGALNRIPQRLGRGAALMINDVFWAEFLANHDTHFTSGLGNLLGSGSAPWYLVCDPLDLAFIQAVFLNGKQTPTVETAEADFNQLGVQMRGYHDFGVNKQEPKGAVKAAVALSITNLGEAEALVLQMRDYNDKPLALRPKYLLTGTGNSVAAREIFQGMSLTGVSSAKNPNVNIFAGKYTPIASAYLPNA